MTEPVVSIRGLAKTYKVYARPWDRLLEVLLHAPRHREFRALRGLDLELERGEALGIIGENGAGKSTFLKILAGVTAPSAGQMAVRGKVASILELGSGFHPEFTGRQNILLNAAMLGLSPEQVQAKTPEIIAFSELGTFIDQPVKCYSTGMAMRLGFAIATQVDPDVLIIDEALSVGDGYFQKKCVDRLLHFLSSGGTLLFCSHAMYYVSAFCRRALWLRNGNVEALGPVEEVVRRYENFLLRKSREEAAQPDPEPVSGPARLLRAELSGRRAEDGAVLVRYLDPWSLEIEWESEDSALEFHLGVGVDRVDGVQVASFSTYHDGLSAFTGQRRYRLTLELPQLPLVNGEFSIYVFLLGERAVHLYDSRVLPGAFRIAGDAYEIGLTRIAHRWQGANEALEPAGLIGAGVDEHHLAASP